MWGDSSYLYVSDLFGNTIRKVSLAREQTEVFAGHPNEPVDGACLDAQLFNPGPIWGDGQNLFIAEASNLGITRGIRKFELATGRISTVYREPTGFELFGERKFESLWGDGENLYAVDVDDLDKFNFEAGTRTTLRPELASVLSHK